MMYIEKAEIEEPDFEFVERKGKGHPDTLSDALAERLSSNYSKFTQQKFGAVLHHNFDKVGLLGGSSYVKFGEGRLTQPIRILLNGRASTKFGKEEVPVKKLLIQWSTEFINEHFPDLDTDRDLEFHYNLSNKSSPGNTKEKASKQGTREHWFEPRSLADISELKELVANDTSMGVGYAPYSRLEQLVLQIEKTLNGDDFKKLHPWIGSDIKVMGFRRGDEFSVTMCIPQISKYVKDVKEYKENIELCRAEIASMAKTAGIANLDLHINTRDDFSTLELYLTATGSSIESGDEGLVGRGNRINGVIAPMRLMSMEGACGKNPVYHIGKLYYVAAQEISNRIYQQFNTTNQVILVSQSGRDLLDPWVTLIRLPEAFQETELVKQLVNSELKNLPGITERLIEQKISMY